MTVPGQIWVSCDTLNICSPKTHKFEQFYKSFVGVFVTPNQLIRIALAKGYVSPKLERSSVILTSENDEMHQ